jgi:phage terminase large subunit-like protein
VSKARLDPLLGMGPKPVLGPTKVLLTAEGARFASFCAVFIQQTKGRWAKKPLYMEPWQLAVTSEMMRNKVTQTRMVNAREPYDEIREWLSDPTFGVVRGAGAGRRQYREAYIQTPKKQGKSTLTSSLALYFLLADGEEGAEVYSVASAADQAKIVFQQAREMAEASSRILAHVRVYKDAIWVPATNSIYRVLGGDADYNEGYNPHAVIIDELHAHKDRKIYDAMTSHIHTGARLDPMVVTITNPGNDPESVCYEVYQQAKLVIDGNPDARKDLFAYVPELLDEEVNDPKTWKKVNPSSWTQVEDLLEAKKKFPRFVFDRRHLNVWTDAEEAWLEYGMWAACEDENVMIPDQAPIYLGVDLGLKHDTAAVCWSLVLDEDTTDDESQIGLVPLRAHVWGLIKERTKYVPPCHTEILGERLPLKLVQNFILEELAPYYEIMEIAYDPYRFEQMAQELADLGFQMVEWPQTDQRMIPATETMWNAIVRDNVLRHNGDEVLRRHFMAAVAEETGRGIRVAKRKATRPNDACIGSLMASHRAILNAGFGSPGIEVLA